MSERDAGPTPAADVAPSAAIPSRPRRRGRKRLLGLLLLVLLFVVLWIRLPVWSTRTLATELGRFFHRPVTVGAVNYHLSPFEAEILDLRVGGATPADPPFLEVPRVRLVPSLQSLFGPQAVLRLLRFERPVVRIHAYPTDGDDIPKMGGESQGGTQIRIQRLVIENGEFLLNHERVPLQLDIPDLLGRFSNRGGGVLAGHLSFGPGKLQFGQNPLLPISSEIDLSLQGAVIRVEDAHLRARNTDLAYTGQLLLRGRPSGEFRLRGPLDLETLDTHVMHSGFGIRGDAFYEGVVQVEGSRLKLNGRIYGTSGVFDRVPVPRFDGHIAWDQRGVILSDLALTTLDGTGTVDLSIPPQPQPSRLSASLHDVDAEGLWRAVFDWGEVGLAGAASGDLALEWPRGHIRQLSGRMQLDLTPRTDGRRPLQGHLAWRATHGRQFVDLLDLKTPSTHVRAEGEVEPDDRANLRVEAESGDLADSDDLFRRLRLALGTTDAQKAGFTGAGSFRGRWLGSLRDPTFEGRASARDLGFLGVVWGQAEWAGAADALHVRSHSLVLHRASADAELWLDGLIATGEYGREDDMDLRVRLREWPAVDFVRAFQWDVKVSGLVSGEGRLTGRRSEPTGDLHLSMPSGTYYGLPFSALELTSALKGTWSELSQGRASVGGGDVRLRGSATADGIYDGHIEWTDVEAGQILAPMRPDAAWSGRISGELTFAGPLERPRLQGRCTSAHLFLGDEGVGALDGSVRALGDGNVTLEGRVRSPRVDAVLAGTLGAAAPHVAALRLTLKDTSLDPWVRVALPRLPSTLALVAGGEVQIDGPLDEPKQLRMSALVPDLQVLLPEYALKNRGALRFAIEHGRLVAHEVQLSGEGSDLQLEGSAALLADGPLQLELRGAADLRALSAVTRRLRGQGAARLAMSVTGTRDAPRVNGRLDLAGGGLRARGFPHGIENAQGSVIFSESRLSFSELRGVLGGGPVELNGNAAYGTSGLRSFDVQAAGHGLTLRYPEGLRSVLDANLRFFGDDRSQWVTGAIDVHQAVWSKRYELATELLSPTRTLAPSAALPGGLHYDVKLRVPGSLRVDNNLATLSAHADLDLTGTPEEPVVLGRAEIERGRVYFQGNTYVIRHGTLDFVNAHKIDPLFDIEAEARVRSYRVTLRVNGTLERVYPTLTSDPPLSAVQILNLLAGADEATVTSLTLSQTDQARLAAAGAATLAAGKLSEDIGLERGAERLFGLSRFSIDPSVVRGGLTNPTARLTAGKRITPDLAVQYSLDLRSAEDRVLTIEYTLSDRLSLLLTQAQPGGRGFDVRFRQTR
jgi:translocation and assembly module TamB